jgi:uncharacterized protein YlxW (UPF0749 family)
MAPPVTRPTAPTGMKTQAVPYSAQANNESIAVLKMSVIGLAALCLINIALVVMVFFNLPKPEVKDETAVTTTQIQSELIDLKNAVDEYKAAAARELENIDHMQSQIESLHLEVSNIQLERAVGDSFHDQKKKANFDKIPDPTPEPSNDN